MNTFNKQHRVAKGLALVAGGLTLALAAGGCQPIAHGEDFAPESAPTAVGKFAETQSANGARQDATLGTQHFDGSDLNSLGEVKLDLIVKATPASSPVTVYVNLPKAEPKDMATACKTSITNYLVDAGVPQTQIQLVDGFNPNASGTAAYQMPTVYKGDNTTGYNGAAGDAMTGADLNAVGTASIGSSGGGH